MDTALMIFTPRQMDAVIGVYQGLSGYAIEIPIVSEEITYARRWSGNSYSSPLEVLDHMRSRIEPEVESTAELPVNEVIEWLESPLGESWSRTLHQDRFMSFASIKEDTDWTYAMHWTSASVSENFDDDKTESGVHVEEPAIPNDYEIPSCP